MYPVLSCGNAPQTVSAWQFIIICIDILPVVCSVQVLLMPLLKLPLTNNGHSAVTVVFSKHTFPPTLSWPLKADVPTLSFVFRGPSSSSPLSGSFLLPHFAVSPPNCVPFICHSPLAVWEEQAVMDANHFPRVPVQPAALSDKLSPGSPP